MATAARVSEDDLRTMLAERSGLERDSLWYPVHDVPRAFDVSWPLTSEQAEDVLSGLLDRFRRVLPAPREQERPAKGYTYLSEITDRYQRGDTRRILERIHTRGITPARPAFDGENYDPRSGRGWGARPSTAPDHGGTPNWSWWREVRAAGPRPLYRMPDPYAGEGEPPVDQALDLRERTGDDTAYRAALREAVREDPRQIDCWAHLGTEAFERADSDESALQEALGYYQTGVAVAELSLPQAFTGVLAWAELDNRPFHRALHGLGLTWWRLGDTTAAAAVFSNSLWTNPEDNQGARYLIGAAKAGVPWHQTEWSR
ncbi:putative cytoplasmic protein [Streptomyces venezuelae]|uniref:hypothetical protein n=1 Tax=Streptomyces gardneri TaxID=66892 RepID=UPI0006BC0EAB|nr:hypothetical protein [Streptomyces gardneri]ALO05622.1 hypothetical protein AQF52_0020 [Streptomyces venezuelae]ALO13666.1 putative cytoplasmic protein [Streptomyces venezuelae]QPK43220.1 hypothetical protein H4W23_00095 [Streptomyces gardneri]QPK50241.1 hypothetical protein H4W23_40525 [Streptomyces gardneri]WRK34431.1 hypothetical protein U0M97_00090 [Streptomyces venezuelae]